MKRLDYMHCSVLFVLIIDSNFRRCVIKRLRYGEGVPLGHIGTGFANMTNQCQYDLEAHLGHIITSKYCPP